MIDPQRIEAAALRLLARREYSVAGLRQRLCDKGHPPQLVDDVVSRLEENGSVSDLRFATEWLRIQRERGHGPEWVAAGMRAHGVDRHTIDSLIEPSSPEWMEGLARIRRKRFGGRPPANQSERIRQFRFLTARGYTHRQIDHLLAEGDE